MYESRKNPEFDENEKPPATAKKIRYSLIVHENGQATSETQLPSRGYHNKLKP